MKDGPIDILVADDDDLLRATLVEVLEADGRFDVVAAVGEADAAITEAARLRPAVALVDVRMPGGGGPRVARRLRTIAPGTSVVALSSYDHRDAVVDMFRCGAVSYLVKGEATNADIARTCIDAAGGKITLPPTVGRQVLDELVGHLERAHAVTSRQRAAEARVRRVLSAQEIDIVYQPIFEVGTGRRVGAEALSRFRAEPTQGPDRWFADAAAVGLGTDLELLAVRRALEGLPLIGGTLSVNVSPATAGDDDFQRVVLGADDPHRIVMEVTEHAPIDDYEAFGRSIEPLRQAGVRLAIDDAGAGFASLRHIVSLAPDIIKLDLSLCRDVDQHRPRRAMARALISFGAESGAAIVAEGIERAAELETLAALGATMVQGYFTGRPSPLEDLPAQWSLEASTT